MLWRDQVESSAQAKPLPFPRQRSRSRDTRRTRSPASSLATWSASTTRYPWHSNAMRDLLPYAHEQQVAKPALQGNCPVWLGDPQAPRRDVMHTTRADLRLAIDVKPIPSVNQLMGVEVHPLFKGWALPNKPLVLECFVETHPLCEGSPYTKRVWVAKMVKWSNELCCMDLGDEPSSEENWALIRSLTYLHRHGLRPW